MDKLRHFTLVVVLSFVFGFVVTSGVLRVYFGNFEEKQRAQVLGISDQLAQTTTCTTPQTCPADYWFDWSTCSCTPHTYTGGCNVDNIDCGPDATLNVDTCLCEHVNQTTCAEPSGGCGSDQYWDVQQCVCVTNPIVDDCSVPQTCPVNYYWDSNMCRCVYFVTSTPCDPPASGCPTNYFWDPSNCACTLYSGTATTTSSSETSDTTTTNTSTTTTTTSSTTVSSDTCREPSGGCAAGYYFDHSKCLCVYKDYSTTDNCLEPAQGCGDGWYFDKNECICLQNTTYETEKVDRFAYESDSAIACVKSKLTDYEYKRLRYLIPFTQSERDEIARLGERVKSCFKLQVTQQSQTSTSENKNTPSSPVDNERCLINAIGMDAYKEIYSDNRTPTFEESQWYKKCYEGKKQRTVTLATNNAQLEDGTTQCLQNVLGEDLYNKVNTGTTDVPVEKRRLVDKCFGANLLPFDGGAVYKVPDEIRSCLLSTVGEDKFNKILEGEEQPTSDEKSKTQTCFDGLNEQQLKFVPAPPEQVAYLDEDESMVSLSQVVQEKKKSKDKETGRGVKLSGKAAPNSVVTIYIFSEPIVVTTQVDENGDWVYELNQPLDGEKHVAYATSRSSSGKIVRSKVFDFTVVASEEPESGQYLQEEVASSPVYEDFIKYTFIMMGISVVCVMGLMTYVYSKKISKMAKHQETERSGRVDRKREEDPGPGPIN